MTESDQTLNLSPIAAANLSVGYRTTRFVLHLHRHFHFLDGESSSPFWKMLEFLGIQKERDVRTFSDLRWICKSPVLQKWYSYMLGQPSSSLSQAMPNLLPLRRCRLRQIVHGGPTRASSSPASLELWPFAKSASDDNESV